MTNEQINIAIAEACGREEESFGPSWHESKTKIPNYCNDLNAMHEAEKVLVGKNNWELCDYVQRLHTATNSWTALATARQRAETFLRTIGKWKEDQ